MRSPTMRIALIPDSTMTGGAIQRHLTRLGHELARIPHGGKGDDLEPSQPGR